jgi:hypothetical protein
MLGTVSDYSLREGHSSVSIIRSTAKQQTVGSHLYMFATDGSRAAAVAFVVLCNQLVRKGDKVLLVSCSYDHATAGAASETLKDYLALAAKLQVCSGPFLGS